MSDADTCDVSDSLAWTHTLANGGPVAGNPCSSWISTNGTATAGKIHTVGSAWTDGCPQVSCASALRLYCIEQ